jgi:hypothetical protein
MSRRLASGKPQSSGQRLKEVLAVGQVLRVHTQQHDKLVFYDAEDVSMPGGMPFEPGFGTSSKKSQEMNEVNNRLSHVIDKTAKNLFSSWTLYQDYGSEWGCNYDFNILMVDDASLPQALRGSI